ncbi:MAG: DUF4347 domain-containing protein, partial [Bacteroidales bacterium]
LKTIIQKISVLSFQLMICSVLYLTAQPAKLIIIDPLVENEYKNPDTPAVQKVIILPDEGNPIKIIADELKKSSYDEIHLFILTKPGSLIFDEINIIPGNIEEYSDDFKVWKSLMKPGSKIIIHSDTLTSEPEGLILTKKITEYTGAAVLVQK